MRTWGSSRAVGGGAGSGVAPVPGRQARQDGRREERGERDRPRAVPTRSTPEVDQALGCIPALTGIMTAAFESRRAGLVVSRIMRCGESPSRVAVAVPSGQRLAMLIRDSRAFGLCLVDPNTRLLMKKFGEDPSLNTSDPFDTLETRTLATGSPLLMAAAVSLDCEVVRHVDLDGDYEIYVGVVVGVVRGRGAVGGGVVEQGCAAGAGI